VSKLLKNIRTSMFWHWLNSMLFTVKKYAIKNNFVQYKMIGMIQRRLHSTDACTLLGTATVRWLHRKAPDEADVYALLGAIAIITWRLAELVAGEYIAVHSRSTSTTLSTCNCCIVRRNAFTLQREIHTNA